MSERFDPYHKWLSIPPKDQPADHYRLLGVSRFEADAEIISNAADQRMAYLRSVQTGPRIAEAQQLLNEVARARITLLDPRRKASYDAALRSAAPADAGQPGAAKAPPQPAVAAGREMTFGRFRLVECLRQSPQANVYRAEDMQSGYSFSLKMLSAKAAADPVLRKRFQREVELSTRLQHPHLVAGYEGGEINGLPYLASEYVVGSDLHTLVAQIGPLPVEQAMEYIDQAACGLAQLHLLKVYHRNVSPRNLLVDLQGRIKVTNLLLARIEEGSALDQGEELTQMGDTMGTVEYLAPEQALDASSVDQRADIYALGCTLHYLLTGKPVYEGRNAMEKMLAHRKQPVPSLRARCPTAPEWLEGVFSTMVAKEPSRRYESMLAVSQDLSRQRQQLSLWERIKRFVLWMRWPLKRTGG